MNYSNPYYNPYGTPNIAQFQPVQQVVRVSGENGARAYQMGANSSALLLDESGTIVLLATTDGASYKTVTPYDITPHKTDPTPDFTSLESRIAKLEEMMNGNTADSSAVKRKKPVSEDASAD